MEQVRNVGIGLPTGVLHQNGIDHIDFIFRPHANRQWDWVEPVRLPEECRQARGRTRRCGSRHEHLNPRWCAEHFYSPPSPRQARPDERSCLKWRGEEERSPRSQDRGPGPTVNYEIDSLTMGPGVHSF